jgi:hypothetical protein
MIYAVFESSYGYNTSLRLGKLYQFTSMETIKYLLDVNPDVVLLNHTFKKLIKKVKIWLLKKKITEEIRKKIKPHHLLELQLGKTWRQIFSEVGIDTSIYDYDIP